MGPIHYGEPTLAGRLAPSARLLIHQFPSIRDIARTLHHEEGGFVTFLNRKWIVLGGIAAVWAVFTITWAIWFVPNPAVTTPEYETTKFVFLSVSAFGVLFTTLLGSFNSVEATMAVRDRIRFDRIENAFAYMLRWDGPSLKDARDLTRRMKRDHHTIAPQTLIARIDGEDAQDAATYQKDDLKRSVIAVMNFFEEIELSIEEERVKPETLKAAFGATYCDIYDRFKPWIEKTSDETQKANLKTLYNRWNS